MLTKLEVAEFKKIVLEIYRIKLTDEQALDQGSRLIQLFELVLERRNLVIVTRKVVQNNG